MGGGGGVDNGFLSSMCITEGPIAYLSVDNIKFTKYTRFTLRDIWLYIAAKTTSEWNKEMPQSQTTDSETIAINDKQQSVYISL